MSAFRTLTRSSTLHRFLAIQRLLLSKRSLNNKLRNLSPTSWPWKPLTLQRSAILSSMPFITDQNEKKLLHEVDTTIKIKKQNKTFIDAIRILPDESNLKLKILRAHYYTLGKSLD